MGIFQRFSEQHGTVISIAFYNAPFLGPFECIYTILKYFTNPANPRFFNDVELLLENSGDLALDRRNHIYLF